MCRTGISRFQQQPPLTMQQNKMKILMSHSLTESVKNKRRCANNRFDGRDRHVCVGRDGKGGGRDRCCVGGGGRGRG